uniref:Uncharacterized protein n=1 Tax=Lepeophtheirus salmonis TaxID=72036 RepID=A0A0K2U6F4_LEPSM
MRIRSKVNPWYVLRMFLTQSKFFGAFAIFFTAFRRKYIFVACSCP